MEGKRKVYDSIPPMTVMKGERKELRGDDQRKMERKGLERKGTGGA